MLRSSTSFPSYERVPSATLPIQQHISRPPPSYSAPSSKKSSLDITQRVERKLAEYNASENIVKRWLFEILSVSTSAVCMGVIIVLYLCMEGRPSEKCTLMFSAVGFLAKIASVTLIIPISEAIGQLKWVWFQGKNSKDAYDFEIFDKASRGPWGSLLLLLRTKGKSLAALGAFLTILLLTVETFFSQMYQAPELWVSKEESFLPRTIRYEPSSEKILNSVDGFSPTLMNGDLASALNPFFFDQNGNHTSINPNNTQFKAPQFCPTSWCEWEPFETLGVCSACVDVSNLLEYGCLTTSLEWIPNSKYANNTSTWPNGTACGYFLNSTSEKPVLMSGYRVQNISNTSTGEALLMRALPLITEPLRHQLYGGSINFKHIQSPIEDVIIVSAADGTANSVYRKERPAAHECVLAWCVKTLRSSYLSGAYKEEETHVLINTTITDYPWKMVPVPLVQIPDMVQLHFEADISIYPPSMPSNGTGFGVSNNTFYSTVMVLDQIFPSMITAPDALAAPLMKYKISFNISTFRSAHSSPWMAPYNITRHMFNIAQAMTNTIRLDPNSNQPVAGKAYYSETTILVRWPWLAFPLAILLLCIAFLVAAMRKTSQGRHGGIGNWKTSAMPTLIYGLPKEMQSSVTSSLNPKLKHGDQTQKIRIKLSPKQGWRVSGYACTSPTRIRHVESRAPPGWI